MIGAGFAARLHTVGLKRLYGVTAEIAAVAARGESADRFAKDFGVPDLYRDYRDLLADESIDVVDITTPAFLHASMIEEAVQAGKHVICEKPFTGYFGQPGDVTPVGHHVAKRDMYERVLASMEKTRRVVDQSGKLFMYAENWVYAPAIAKTAEILSATGDKVLFMKAEESHSGSHAGHAARWDLTGGGSMIRQGCHPLTAVLYLKRVEATARGEQIKVTSVTCETGNIAAGLPEEQKKYIQARPVDVEDWSMLTLSFSDGTKATVFAGDFVLGGGRNLIETFTNGGVLEANIVPNSGMIGYFTDETKLAEIAIREKVDRKIGWQFVTVAESWNRGYISEIQDFMECVRDGRQPLSDLSLAFETSQLLYAGYWAAEDGLRVNI